ncbi:MAG TPA: helix-turn-helix transcriptional regulator [Euzebyales bacterium]|nr:helix-turn-helix transcriptional regulator [Euzebyales bacterium]
MDSRHSAPHRGRHPRRRRRSQRAEERSFHGDQLAKHLSDDGRRLIGHGTLYKALGRLTEAGLLSNGWEDPDMAVAEGRPRRRLYEVTGAGEQALIAW